MRDKTHKTTKECTCGHHALCGEGDTPTKKIKKEYFWYKVTCHKCLRKRSRKK